MPHTGRIDESLRGEARLFMRARLHVEGSMKRLSEGQIEDAIAAMYDAISSAMQRYTYEGVRETMLEVHDGEALSDDFVLFRVLKRSNIIDDSVDATDFEYLSSILNEALEFQLDSLDLDRFLDLSRNLLTQMNIISTDERLIVTNPISQ